MIQVRNVDVGILETMASTWKTLCASDSQRNVDFWAVFDINDMRKNKVMGMPPIAGWFKIEHPSKMDDLGLPL